MQGKLYCKRIYEKNTSAGYRILVDRLWPRGMKKDDAHLDEWAKEIAPSSTLRSLFHQDKLCFEDFAQRYTQELENNTEAHAFLLHVKDLLDKGDVLLVYGAKDVSRNHAIVLKDWLDKNLEG